MPGAQQQLRRQVVRRPHRALLLVLRHHQPVAPLAVRQRATAARLQQLPRSCAGRAPSLGAAMRRAQLRARQRVCRHAARAAAKAVVAGARRRARQRRRCRCTAHCTAGAAALGTHALQQPLPAQRRCHRHRAQHATATAATSTAAAGAGGRHRQALCRCEDVRALGAPVRRAGRHSRSGRTRRGARVALSSKDLPVQR
eukprot:64609-Chlamydomonas_euryale.AAC.1